MKKVLLIAAVAVFGMTSVNAQQMAFGAKAGFNSLSVTDGEGSLSGFAFGLVGEYQMNDAFAIQPEILYSSFSESGVSMGMLQVPIMAKYYVAPGISLQAGPQINYILEEMGDDFSALGVGLTFGAGYDINDNIFIDARYGLELMNRYTGEGDGEFKYNILSIGVGYMF